MQRAIFPRFWNPKPCAIVSLVCAVRRLSGARWRCLALSLDVPVLGEQVVGIYLGVSGALQEKLALCKVQPQHLARKNQRWTSKGDRESEVHRVMLQRFSYRHKRWFGAPSCGIAPTAFAHDTFWRVATGARDSVRSSGKRARECSRQSLACAWPNVPPFTH